MRTAAQRVRLGATILAVAVLTAVGQSPAAEPRRGEVRFEPTADEPRVAERFRLPAHEFAFEQTEPANLGGTLEISRLTFPSPVETPHAANNTVHCEYFCPVTPAGQRRPAVVVLHILGGDFPLSRLICTTLSTNGVAALFLKMPYYGPRRDPQSNARMISQDPRETVAGMTQAVLDIRRAVVWLAAREEVDPDQIGICGVSLGGITSALAATAEPRIAKVCPILAGGDVGRIVWESPELSAAREKWVRQGGTRESLVELLKTVDPVTYAGNLGGRKVLMLNAAHDEVIPRACTESLWEAFGRPRIVWFNAGHYSALKDIFTALRLAVDFFQSDTPPAPPPD